jgi:sortase A
MRRRTEPRRERGRRRVRIALGCLGASLLLYAATLLLWGDPTTSLYTWWQQRALAAELERDLGTTRDNFPELPDNWAPGVPAGIEAKAGTALGWITIPRLGLRKVFVEGTRARDLRRAPGHYPMTALPGSGKTVAIAGHRTTFGAPFRHIDELSRGDLIELALAYGEFRYRVFAHEVVDRRDWSIVRDRRAETLVLSACHPLYSAAQRWVVYARRVA